jgi:hypothetical protein
LQPTDRQILAVTDQCATEHPLTTAVEYPATTMYAVTSLVGLK